MPRTRAAEGCGVRTVRRERAKELGDIPDPCNATSLPHRNYVILGQSDAEHCRPYSVCLKFGFWRR